MERSRSAKAERERLQDEWRRLGWTYDRIAAEFQRRYHVGPLTAHRWAHRMTLQDVADHWNQLRVDDERVMVLQTISDWERGVREPPVSVLNRLAQIFHTTTANLIEGVDFRHLDPARNGAARTLTPSGLHVASPDEEERYRLAVEQPKRVDEGVVGYLTRVLAEHRRADDLFGPKGMLPAITGQLEVIESFIVGARPEVRRSVLYVACQYAQLLGWMYQDASKQKKAEHWYSRAEEWALESGNLPMVATALSMKADQAWTFEQPYRAVSLAQAAQQDRWRSPPGLRALIAHQGAAAYALAHTLTGDPAEAQGSRRKLEEILGHVGAMQEGRQEEMPWTYFFTPEFSRMQRATVLRNLGDAEASIPLYEQGLGKLGAGHKRERGQYLARLGFAYFLAGDEATALAHAEEAAGIARDTGSIRTAEELQRFKARAGEARAEAALRRLEELLGTIVAPQG